ncbi:MAG: hypothetical protein JSV62_03745 [Promethearchaeota archaeon]|nr:MAG: hypothetical protein JSV62_03745 [Candidatus Lokiarchaeota archaeon]
MSDITEKYSMKIPKKLKDLFQAYIDKNPGLGFTKVSQFILFTLQEKAVQIKKEIDEKSKK